MKKIALTALVIVAGTVAAYSQTEQNLPTEIYVEGAKNHVQGIAYDKAVGSMYFSFTTSFIKTDMEGKVLGSIDRIQGHLGAMTFNPSDRKVYASLECKDDVIGAGLSSFAKGRSMFYIAIIDVDKVTEVGMDSEDNDAFRIVCVKDATRDYHMTGFADKEYEHFYGWAKVAVDAVSRNSARKAERTISMWLTASTATLAATTTTIRCCSATTSGSLMNMQGR